MSYCIDTPVPVLMESWERALFTFETLLQEVKYWDLCFRHGRLMVSLLRGKIKSAGLFCWYVVAVWRKLKLDLSVAEMKTEHRAKIDVAVINHICSASDLRHSRQTYLLPLTTFTYSLQCSAPHGTWSRSLSSGNKADFNTLATWQCCCDQGPNALCDEYVTEAHFATRLSITTESPDGAHCRLSPAFEFFLRCTGVESGCSEMRLDAEAMARFWGC
jgi:hypothetical protein